MEKPLNEREVEFARAMIAQLEPRLKELESEIPRLKARLTAYRQIEATFRSDQPVAPSVSEQPLNPAEEILPMDDTPINLSKLSLAVRFVIHHNEVVSSTFIRQWIASRHPQYFIKNPKASEQIPMALSVLNARGEIASINDGKTPRNYRKTSHWRGLTLNADS